jgi:hypothetical protein
MACKPPIKPKSIPYWNGVTSMTPHAKKQRQLARIVVWSVAMLKDVL